MKRSYRILAILICLSCLCMVVGFSTPVDTELLKVEQAMRQQEGALDAYELLFRSFPKDEETGLPIYPDEYAGEYIDGDKLVLQLTQNTPENQSKYLELCNNSDKVVFRQVPYSLNFLESLEGQALEFSKRYDVVGWGVQRKNNNFVIRVLEEDYNEIQRDYSRQRSSLPITFEIESKPQNCATSLIGGNKISTNGYSFSIGIGGKYNGQPALLMCGHKTAKNGNVTYNGTVIGKVVKSQYSNGAVGDWGIVQITNSSYSPTHNVCSSGSNINISDWYSSAPEGTSIYKYGYSGGYAYGTIISTQQSIDYNGLVVKGLTTSSVTHSTSGDPVLDGDSGGPVYFKQNGVYKICGTVSGRRQEVVNGYQRMYHSPIYFAMDTQFVSPAFQFGL